MLRTQDAGHGTVARQYSYLEIGIDDEQQRRFVLAGEVLELLLLIGGCACHDAGHTQDQFLNGDGEAVSDDRIEQGGQIVVCGRWC